MNKRLLSLLVAVSVVTTATFSGGFPVFAGNEETKVTDAIESVETSILESVDKLLEKKNATGSDAEEAEIPEVIKIDTEGQETNSSDIVLTATAEDGMVVTLSATSGAFPYEDLDLVAHVVTGEEAEEASEEIDAKKPAENTAKRVTYDIQVQHNGEEVQPIEGKKVNVSFKVADAPSGADEVTVYHHDEADGKVEEIASTELTDAASTVVDSSETNVVISKDEGSPAVTSSDADNEEYYEDYEIEDDVTITGETGSFSLYTVDFTYDDKMVSIAGDTDHNELSSVLAEIGISDAIVDAKAYMDEACTQPAANNTVTVDGKDLFKVYADGGTWYVDAINAFSTTHGLLIKTADAEYKVKVTDYWTVYTIYIAEGSILKLDGNVLTKNYEVRSDFYDVRIYNYGDSFDIEYYECGWRKTLHLTQEDKPGYKFQYWLYTTGTGGHVEPVSYEIKTAVKVEADSNGTVNCGSEIQARMYAPIKKNGDTLTIDGYGDIKASPKDTKNIFKEWQISPVADEIREGTSVKAVFAQAEGTVGITAKTQNNSDHGAEGGGTVQISGGSIVHKNSTVKGNKSSLVSSDELYIDGITIKANASPSYSFYKWTSVPETITSDTTLTAEFWETSNPVTVKITKPQLGRLETNLGSDTVQLPKGAKIYLDGNIVKFGENQCYYVQPIPGADCAFLKWVDGNGQQLKSGTTVDTDMILSPIFVYNLSQYIDVVAGDGGKLLRNGNSAKSFYWIIDGMYGTKITPDQSNPSRLVISYLNFEGQKITEYVDAVADSGYKFKSPLWTGIPETTMQEWVTVNANFEEDLVDVNFNTRGENGGNGSILQNGSPITSKTGIRAGKTITEYGSRLIIEGENTPIIASPSSSTDVFLRWEGIPANKQLDANTSITAVFNGGENTVIVTPDVSDQAAGTVYPVDPVQIISGSDIGVTGQTASSSQLTIGNQKFTAVTNKGYSFTGWTLNGEYTGWFGTKLTSNATLKAHFEIPSNPQTITLATPDNGKYEKSFEGDTLTVSAGTEYRVNGANITIGLGAAYITAYPNKNCEFVCWRNVDTGQIIEDGSKSSTSAGAVKIKAEFDYIYTPQERKVENPSSGGGGGSVMGALDKTNYHAEHTYGSMDAPINDGLWELLNDGTWKYNWKVPMASAWGCIVNPYANAGAGQQPHGWFFFNPSGIMLTGWRLVDGKWYYLEPISNGCRGQLYTNTTTPDGYKVDENGAWIQ